MGGNEVGVAGVSTNTDNGLVSGKVSYGKIPGDIIDVEIQGRTTIRELFSNAGLNIERCEIMRNGFPVDATHYVQPGDTILAVTKIQGNVHV